MVEQFCKSILQLEIERSKGLANLVMGLGSQTFARSVAEISLSPCYHFQFSSINKAIDAIYTKPAKPEEGQASVANDREEVEKNLSLKAGLLAKPFGKFWLFNTDSSPLFRPHSPTLPQRRYVYKATNQVKWNKPVEVGYERGRLCQKERPILS